MSKSGYLAKQQAYVDTKCEAVRRVHQQLILDSLAARLYNDEAMGNEPWEPARIRAFIEGLVDDIIGYMPAIEGGVEADVKQEHLDRDIKPVWEDEFVKFEQRYPEIRKITY